MEGVSLPPQGRIYSSRCSALTVAGKSETGDVSPQAPDQHMPWSPCKPQKPLRDTPAPAHTLAGLLFCPLLQHSRLQRMVSLYLPQAYVNHRTKRALPDREKKILNHFLLIMCHGYI